MKATTLAALIIAAAPLALHGQASSPQTAKPAASTEQGRKLFASYGCYQCHGYEGQGSTATGPRLAPKPMPYAALSKYIRAPTGQMPPYTTKVLSESDLAQIYAFLESRPAATPVDQLPLLRGAP